VNLDPLLLEILACPDCRAALRPDEAASELVREDIPVLLIDEARRPGPSTSGPEDGG